MVRAHTLASHGSSLGSVDEAAYGWQLPTHDVAAYGWQLPSHDVAIAGRMHCLAMGGDPELTRPVVLRAVWSRGVLERLHNH